QDLADGGLAGGRLPERLVGLDLVAVTPALLLLDDVAGLGEVGDDAVGAALGDPDPLGDVAQPDAGVMGDADQHPSVVGEEVPTLHAPDSTLSDSRKLLLVFGAREEVGA